MNRLQYKIVIILFIFISCKNTTTNGQVDGAKGPFDFTSKYTYEDISEQDDEPYYDMRNWSKDKKDFYYKKIEEIIFYSMENSVLPNNSNFQKVIEEVFNHKIDTSKPYSILPYSIFESDTLLDHTPQIIVLNNKNILAFNRKLPLLTEKRQEYYNSEDFPQNNYTYNNVLNTALFKAEDIVEEYINNETYYSILEYLVFSYHYQKNDFVLNKVIQSTISNLNDYDGKVILQLFFQRDKYVIDLEFVKKLSHLDTNSVLRLTFEESLQKVKNISQEEKKIIIKNIHNLYNSQELSNLENYKTLNLSNEDILGEFYHDINGDGHKDYFIISSFKTNDNICKMRVTILKGNGSKQFNLWYNNENVLFEFECDNGRENFKRIVFKNNFFTLEELSSDKWEIAKYYKTFKFSKEEDIILLSKYGIITENINGDSRVNEKVFTHKDFGYLSFDNLTQDDFINLD